MTLCEGVGARRYDRQSQRTGSLANGVIAAVCALLVLGCIPVTPAPAEAQAQTQRIVACPATQQPLIQVPEIRSNGRKLRATLKLVDGVRTLWGFAAGSTGSSTNVTPADNRCATQNLRYLVGYDPNNPAPWPAGPDPIPGPTFRARVGDMVQIGFFNQVNENNFAGTLDRDVVGSFVACDQYTGNFTNDSTKLRFKAMNNDTFPNCLHGSSTTNVHFHGTHTTPSTTGDNVLLFVRPAMRSSSGQLQPSEDQVNPIFNRFFSQVCDQIGAPTQWNQLPQDWRDLQKSLLQQYDSTAVYQGNRGALPDSSKLWPTNQSEIDHGLWPQYQLGANPYCFPLPTYNPATMRMGQSPGTHWYHAHKHGSTALNVANGLLGTFIIEGQYDDDLKAFYGQNLVQQVLMIEQLSAAPFPLTISGAQFGPGAPRPRLFVNGRINPVVSMRPNEVQLWRITDGAFRDAVDFVYFEPQTTTSCSSNKPPATPNPAAPQWRQIAQDGVQFKVDNYGAINNPFNLAPANRADLLVKSPTQAGRYTLCVIRNVAMWTEPFSPRTPVTPTSKQQMNGAPDSIPPITALLTVNVAGTPVSPAMDFIPNAQFPTFPAFLADIKDSEVNGRSRTLTFGAGNSTINGVSFRDGRIDQAMQLNTAEEWVVASQATDKAHPFHIHINPFQITQIFEPNNPNAVKGDCKPDPLRPETFDPAVFDYANRGKCINIPSPWIWWDTFAIPTASQVNINSTCTGDTISCPPNIRKYATCGTSSSAGKYCYVTMNGWFKMRSRFVDYTGGYVLHCHILIHEDRGMMQLIEVVSDKSPYVHH